MNEDQFGSRVQHLLDEAIPLAPNAAERLRAAREQALARQRAAPAPALQWADNLLGSLGGWSGMSLRVLLPLALLLAGLIGIYAWQQKQTLAEIEEIDALLLTDELPLDAYLDRGFQDWLKKRGGGEQ
ncbi:MAG: DNA-directed polymerase specialized sigma subunit [Burkholderiales bacterium]|jgi:uncharacterized iron-regulated membrane protein|nr:DNA-directed polymerase specialized sigma subunit [Burkholderiales bacterium]